ncbi:hypothetical protein [Chengkuizengella sediminis]|uniref:hypothetical protein n=1 Tax=Chengkuizengella sediminis TaxID=1885917 RepID=UPI001389A5C9|nr:hypothetical protein [Chengkuizengella sediminis]NDI36060.1 hypothetical protein [Chengkuizengella sediminis]
MNRESEMDNEKLVKLRKHQFILNNLTMLIILIFFLGLTMLDITTKQFYFGAATLFIVQFIFYLKYGITDLLLHTKKMRELHEYEKKKLGKEERKQRFLVIGSQFSLIVCFVILGTIAPYEEKFFRILTFSSLPQLGISYFFFFMMILMNVITFFRNRAFDRSKNLEGFTMKMFLISLLFAFFISSIFLSSIFFFI